MSEIWRLHRGEKPTNENAASAGDQYAVHAKAIARFDDFSGSAYSFGDRYFDRLITGEEIGYPRGIIRAGINHHITVVVDQLATLSSSLTNQSLSSEVEEEEQPLLELHE